MFKNSGRSEFVVGQAKGNSNAAIRGGSALGLIATLLRAAAPATAQEAANG